MRLIPTKQQFKKWSLPTKTGYIVGWLALILGAIYYFSGPSRSRQIRIEDGVKSIEQLLIQTENALYDRLKTEYPLGYAILYIDGTSFTYRAGKNNLVKIDWNTVSITQADENKIIITFHKIENMKSHGVFEDSSFIFDRRPHDKKRIFWMDSLKIYSETYILPNNIEFYVIGFSE